MRTPEQRAGDVANKLVAMGWHTDGSPFGYPFGHPSEPIVPMIAREIEAAVRDAVGLIYGSWYEATDLGGDTDFGKLVERIQREMPWIFDATFRARFPDCFDGARDA